MQKEIEKLEPWWEKIYLDKDNLYTPGGRRKDVLLSNLDNKTSLLKDIKGKKILDIECNAGELMLELSKRGADVVAIDVNDIYIKQANFIKKYYNLENCKVIKYNICKYTTEENIKNLGKFDIICYFGLIYHLHYENNLSIFNYIYKATDFCISSSQITPHPQRKLNWELSVENINKLIYSVGYKTIIPLILDESKIGELTNAYYFEIKK